MHFKIAMLSPALFLCVAAAACAEVVDLQCEQTASAEYKLTYRFTADTHSVDILASTDPFSEAASQKVVHTADTSITVPAGKAGQRMYFFIKPDHGSVREVSIRHLPLQGTPNFRDLGGYKTADGKFVRWGLLYRSGVLTQLTGQDFAYLTPLGIRVVCDFRTDEENKISPETWIPDAQVEHLHLPIGADANNKTVMASWNAFLATNPGPQAIKQHLIEAYSGFAFTNAPEYAKVFVQLKQDRLPLLYHCTGGKDRTGIFSALLLLTLGVPEKTVLQDYALTNVYLTQGLSKEAAHQMLVSSGNQAMAKLSPDQSKILMAADPDYLRSTLQAIDTKYGSFDNYRRDALGVSDQDVELLKAHLLTDW